MNTMKFECLNCGKTVSDSQYMGTENRNHCPFCLWSKHVDINPGDRAQLCQGLMEPIGLTFKNEGVDKYGKKRQGELMLIHRCQKCGKISINRVAGDDDPQEIFKLFLKSSQTLALSDQQLEGIKLLGEKDKKEVEKQLFGKKS